MYSQNMDHYNKPLPTVLIHHGIKGQKWGVQNGPPYPLKKDSTTRFDYGKMNLTPSSRPTVLLPRQEYAHVMSEVATHISDEQKEQRVFRKTIGNISYEFENNFDGTYRVVSRRKVDNDVRHYLNGRSDDE